MTSIEQILNAPKMRVTRTCRIAGHQNHLLGRVAQEQVYWVTDQLISDEQWNRILAIKRAEERAKRQARGLPPNKFNSVPTEPSENQVQSIMSLSIINVEMDLSRSRPLSRPSSQPSLRPPSRPLSQPLAQSPLPRQRQQPQQG